MCVCVCLSELISFSKNVIYELSRMWTHRCTPGVLVRMLSHKEDTLERYFDSIGPLSGGNMVCQVTLKK